MQEEIRVLGRSVKQIVYLLLVVAACSKENSSLPTLPIQNESELAEMTEFIIREETTLEDVSARLGDPFFTIPKEDGGIALGFILDSVPYEIKEGESSIGIFAPGKDGSKLISVEASIWVAFNSENKVVDYSIRGPRS